MNVKVIEDNKVQKVSFTQMKDGTKDEFLMLHELEKPYLGLTAMRIMDELRRQGEVTLEGYQITRLQHGLQSATRAEADGADIDWIVGALLHDIGDGLAPQNHDRFSAEVIRPFVRWEVSWVVEHHGLFQMLYFARHYGWDENARDRYKDHICFDTCAAFCERWDQSSFDPEYPTKTLEHFEPMLSEVFARKAYDPAVIQEGVSIGL
ncbi:HD domain-containing protein [Parasedimentitalea psychrophila]|uniref:HD domain-containing protein n=1 Tax=Parasedimentitalea psychrophila TaxID=2997337 RepID=A0A9Y2L3D5_9RHOB|nr:HD domain-containing protein [Parasedimentitalea psychrophila]WIY26149.1 HD domain-containing protein [Parasedimentitalea psychrophila]